MRTKVLLTVLSLTAITQATYLLLRPQGAVEAQPAQDLVLGDRVETIRVRNNTATGIDYSLSKNDGRWTAVLVYDSACAHSDRVTDAWSDWTGERDDLFVVGLASDALPTATQYANERGWAFDAILSVVDPPSGSVEARLVKRTPWLYLLDDRGVLRFQGHGNDLRAMDSVLTLSRHSTRQ